MTLRRSLGSVLLSAAVVSALTGCGGTLDSLGGGSTELPQSLQTVAHSGKYYNAFSDLLNKQNAEISSKIDAAFQQLFHGSEGQYIFYEQQTAPDRSSIVDTLHNDVRTEGLSLAMLITIELNHQKEFDELWRYSKAKLQVPSGPAKGYFDSVCGEDAATDCYDVYGMQNFVLALMLANGRWHSTADMPYESDALALLDALLNKELDNGGVVNGIGSGFSREKYLVREEPTLADAGFTTRSSLQMPAAYWYWAKATGMPFWSSAAKASRALLVNAANANTGLWPMRSYFDGAPVDGSPGYTQQAYRTQLNLALDALWGTATPDQTELANRVINFFSSEGIATYGSTFDTDGTPLETSHAQALVSVNGALSVAAPTNANRKAFVQAVWDQVTPTGDYRYYEGLLYLMSMLILSGQMQVY
jgi:oligosaccharide reducing-end xylanase